MNRTVFCRTYLGFKKHQKHGLMCKVLSESMVMRKPKPVTPELVGQFFTTLPSDHNQSFSNVLKLTCVQVGLSMCSLHMPPVFQ